MVVTLLQGVGDLPGVGQQHTVDGLRPAPGRAQRVAVEVVDDFDVGVAGQGAARVGLTLDSAKIALTFSLRMGSSSLAVSSAEGSAWVETLGMTAPTTLRPKALVKYPKASWFVTSLREPGGISLRIAWTCARVSSSGVCRPWRWTRSSLVRRVGFGQRGGDVVGHLLGVGGVVPDVRVVDLLPVLFPFWGARPVSPSRRSPSCPP